MGCAGGSLWSDVRQSQACSCYSQIIIVFTVKNKHHKQICWPVLLPKVIGRGEYLSRRQVRRRRAVFWMRWWHQGQPSFQGWIRWPFQMLNEAHESFYHLYTQQTVSPCYKHALNSNSTILAEAYCTEAYRACWSDRIGQTRMQTWYPKLDRNSSDGELPSD